MFESSIFGAFYFWIFSNFRVLELGISELWRFGILELLNFRFFDFWEFGIFEPSIFGIWECSMLGIFGFWSFQCLEFWTLAFWSLGIIECWNFRLLGFSNFRDLEFWKPTSRPPSKEPPRPGASDAPNVVPRGWDWSCFMAKLFFLPLVFWFFVIYFGNRPRDHHKWTLRALELRMHHASSRKDDIEAVLWRNCFFAFCILIFCNQFWKSTPRPS